MNYVRVNNLRIAYRQRGTGPHLVLLHGGLSDSRSWRPQLDGLSDQYTVTAWDAPGCGQSDDPPSEDITLVDYANYVAGFLDQLDIKRSHLLGLSFGGGLALKFYQQYPHIPRTLLLASAYAGWAGSLEKEEVQTRLEKGMRQSKLPPDEVIQEWLPTLFTETAPDDIIAETAGILRDFHPAGMRAMLRAFANADLRSVLPEMTIPALLLYGEKDQRSPIKTVALSMQQAIPNSNLVKLPEVGHLGNVVTPDKFNSKIRHFLQLHGD